MSDPTVDPGSFPVFVETLFLLFLQFSPVSRL